MFGIGFILQSGVKPHTGRRYPCCRLVLTPAAAIELINHMQRMAAHLVQAGVLKAEQPAAAPASAKELIQRLAGLLLQRAEDGFRRERQLRQPDANGIVDGVGDRR